MSNREFIDPPFLNPSYGPEDIVLFINYFGGIAAKIFVLYQIIRLKIFCDIDNIHKYIVGKNKLYVYEF